MMIEPMQFQPPSPVELDSLQTGALDDSSIVYRAWQIIISNGWESKKTSETVVDEMLDLYRASRHGNEDELCLAFWLLSEVSSRKDVVLSVMGRGLRIYFLRQVIPYLSFAANVLDDLLDKADESLASGSNDAGIRLEAIELWSARHPAEALASIVRRGEQVNETSLRLLRGALTAGNTLYNREVLDIYHDWRGKTTEHQAVAVALASSLAKANMIAEYVAIEHIRASLSSTNDRLWPPALWSFQRMLEISQSPALLQLFQDLISDLRPLVKATLAQAIAFAQNENLLPLAPDLLRHSVTVDPVEKGLVSLLDDVASKLVGHGDIRTVTDFLTQWVLAHPKDEPKDFLRESGFDYSLYSLATKHWIWLQRLITRWLLDDLELLKRAEVIMERFEISRYDPGVLMFVSDEQFELLADRGLAVHIGGGDKTYKLLLSLSGHASNPKRFAALKASLETMAVNYAGYTERLLKSFKPKDSLEQQLLTVIEHTHNEYFNGRKWPELAEFHPPRTRYAKFMAYRQRYQSEVNEEIRSSGDFPLSSMMSTVVIARGDRYVTHYPDGSISEPSGFAQFSAEYELPRLWMAEPEHYEYEAKLVRRRVRREIGD